MIYTVLQAGISEIINPHLADQMFTVVLLVAFAIWMVRKQKEERLEREKLQDRLERYMADDRKTMMDVIERNTRVMERIEDNLEKTKG